MPPSYKQRMDTKRYLRQAWSSMKSRCGNPRNKSFKNYGGRGIKVCEKWENSFLSFVKDVGPRPTEQHTLGRINNYGNYEPGNVRWETQTQQQRNKRSNVVITALGRTQTLAEWGEEKGLRPETIKKRIAKYGWEPGMAVSAQPPSKEPAFEWEGECYSLAELAEKFGIRRKTLSKRLYKSKWSLEKALLTPVPNFDYLAQFE